MDLAQLDEPTRWASTLLVGALAIAFELRTRRIPNALTLGGLAPALALAFLLGRLGESLEAFLLAGAVGVFLFQKHALAGGGVKTAALLAVCAGLEGAAALAVAGLTLGLGGLAWERLRPSKPVLHDAVPSTPVLLPIALVGLAVRLVLARS